MKSFRQYTEEIKPNSPQENGEDKALESKEKRQMQIKKMVLLKKMQAVRAGAGADIVASHTPEGEMVEAKVDDVKYSKDEKRKNYETDVHTLSSNKGVRTDRNKRRSATDVVFHGHSKVERDRKQAHYKSRGVKKVKGVKEEKDKAFEYVKKQIAAKYGKSGYVSKDNPRKPQSAAEKAKARAHQAKVDKENAAERAKDPSQGRYPKG